MPEKGQVLTPAEREEKFRRYDEDERFRQKRIRDADAEHETRLRGIPQGPRFASVTPKQWEGGLLWGKPGRGKTHEAICRLLSTPKGVFVTAPNLLKLARARELDSIDTFQADRLRRIERADHLVIDDIGVHRPSAFALEVLYLLIDDRWIKGSETLLTSNLDPRTELVASLDARILSRALGFGPVVEIGGDDHRWSPVPSEIR